METHKVVHDFSELDYQDIVEAQAAPGVDEKFRASPYPFLFAALAVGFFLGALSRRN